MSGHIPGKQVIFVTVLIFIIIVGAINAKRSSDAADAAEYAAIVVRRSELEEQLAKLRTMTGLVREATTRGAQVHIKVDPEMWQQLGRFNQQQFGDGLAQVLALTGTSVSTVNIVAGYSTVGTIDVNSGDQPQFRLQ